MYKNCHWSGVPAWQQRDREPLPEIKNVKSPCLYRLTDGVVIRVKPESVPECLTVGFRLPKVTEAETSRAKAIDAPTAYQLREKLRKTTASPSGVRGGTALNH